MPTLTEWFFDPRIDYASQTQMMADLCDLAMTMTRRIYENTIMGTEHPRNCADH